MDATTLMTSYELVGALKGRTVFASELRKIGDLFEREGPDGSCVAQRHGGGRWIASAGELYVGRGWWES